MNKKTITIGLAVIAAFVFGYLISKQDEPSSQEPGKQTTQQAPSTSGGPSLDSSGQQLTSLPESILSRSDLVSLDLSNNQLITLPASITRLSKLQSLNVENNRLVTFPSEINQLMNLREIKANNNRLTTLPQELFTMTQLKLLDISGNNLPADTIRDIKAALPNTEVKS